MNRMSGMTGGQSTVFNRVEMPMLGATNEKSSNQFMLSNDTNKKALMTVESINQPDLDSDRSSVSSSFHDKTR